MPHTIDTVLTRAPVIPVIVIEELAHAVPLARALVAGGLSVLEVTLRTPVAIDAMVAIRDAVPDALVGAGTVLDVASLDRVIDAGCDFIVSPGATDALLERAKTLSVPFLPGAATASECMRLLERGHRAQKFFPAAPAGGPAYLKALAAPLPAVRFCPTGGVTLETAPAYLALPNVACVGGSWMLPPDRIRAGDWDTVSALARGAAALRG